MKSSYSFEDRGTDRRNDRQNIFRNVFSKTFPMIYDTPTKAENKLATRKTIYLPITLEHNKTHTKTTDLLLESLGLINK